MYDFRWQLSVYHQIPAPSHEQTERDIFLEQGKTDTTKLIVKLINPGYLLAFSRTSLLQPSFIINPCGRRHWMKEGRWNCHWDRRQHLHLTYRLYTTHETMTKTRGRAFGHVPQINKRINEMIQCILCSISSSRTFKSRTRHASVQWICLWELQNDVKGRWDRKAKSSYSQIMTMKHEQVPPHEPACSTKKLVSVMLRTWVLISYDASTRIFTKICIISNFCVRSWLTLCIIIYYLISQ